METEQSNMKMNASLQLNEARERNNHSSARAWNGLFCLLKRPLALGLALTALAAVVAPLAAADFHPAAPEKKQAVPTTLTGRIIYVDKGLNAMAVEIKGKILQVNVVPSLRINKDGKLVKFEELAAGQEVTLTFRETVTGRLEVVMVNVEASPEAAEAAGGTKTTQGLSKGQGPFSSDPNPANLGGQIRSQHH